MVRHLGYTVADYMETIEHLSPTWLDFIEVGISFSILRLYGKIRGE